jgi:quercetin dioxygenase-like cupin family protein
MFQLKRVRLAVETPLKRTLRMLSPVADTPAKRGPLGLSSTHAPVHDVREDFEMPDIQTDSSSRAPNTGAETFEVFSPQKDVRPGNQYLTEVTEGDGTYCVMQCTFPPGVVVPMHSHADRETFFILSGNPDLFLGDHWETLGPGDLVDVQDGIRHAWRNSSRAAVSMLCITTMRLARFLRDVSADDGSGDPAASGQRFLRLVEQHGYWLASPQENAAIGLGINWGEDTKPASA